MRGWIRSIAKALSLVGAVAISACAVQSGPRGQIQIGLDDAEIFGQAVDSFRLSDGSEGKVRVLGGRYSVKLQKRFKVVPIANATMVRVISTQEVGGRTLLVLEKTERNCAYKTQVMSILGGEVLSWDFGDCQTQPQIRASGEQAIFDFVQPRRTQRYVYREGRLLRGEFATQAGGSPNVVPPPSDDPPDTSSRRYQPSAPVSVTAPTVRPAPGGPAATVKTRPTANRAPAAPAPRSPAPPPPRALDFPTQEQKPVRIVLDD